MRMNSVVPVFKVADVGATARWYRDTLGFHFDTFPDRKPFEWANLQSGTIEIFLQRVDGYHHESCYRIRPASGWDAYIRMEGALGYFEAVASKVRLLESPKKQGYGDTEFVIEDCNGYVLVFSEFI